MTTGKNKLFAAKKSLLSKSNILMSKLEETIAPIKNDFICAQLLPSCSFCREYFIQEKPINKLAWFHPEKPNNTSHLKSFEVFSICDTCYRYEQNRTKLQITLSNYMAGTNDFPSGVSLYDLV